MTTEYDPVLRIDQRLLPEGGAVLTPASPCWREPPGKEHTQHELIVLVHGFNNDRNEASNAYAGLRQRQRALLGDAVAQRFEAELADVFWPGDADWGVIDAADFLSYPIAVGIARDEVARPLADYLRTRSQVQTVHFLGHSLGCRVVLEVLADLARTRDGPAIGKVCLMAAAVPVAMMCAGGRLEKSLDRARDILVLYSTDDHVLTAAFPPGQTLAGRGEGFFPEAVGHAGNLPANVRREQIPGAAHGHYWGHEKSPAVLRAAECIQAFFAYGSAGNRTLSARTTASPRKVADSREVAWLP